MLILPLGKQGQSGIPFLTLLVCLGCVAVYMAVTGEHAKLSLAYYPGSSNLLKMFSSAFVHGDIFHLVGNLFFFYCFSRTVESEIPARAYLLAFLLFAIATNVAYSASATEPIPTIGLSGVVWGFMGLFLMRYPKDSIDCLVWYLWVIRTIQVPAFMFILAFLAFDIGAFREEPNSNINHIAHISGFVAGVILHFGFWAFLSREDPDARKRPGRRSQVVSRSSIHSQDIDRNRGNPYDRY
jgi:membrane associated rhomboid family serine protease